MVILQKAFKTLRRNWEVLFPSTLNFALTSPILCPSQLCLGLKSESASFWLSSVSVLVKEDEIYLHISQEPQQQTYHRAEWLFDMFCT